MILLVGFCWEERTPSRNALGIVLIARSASHVSCAALHLFSGYRPRLRRRSAWTSSRSLRRTTTSLLVRARSATAPSGRGHCDAPGGSFRSIGRHGSPAEGPCCVCAFLCRKRRLAAAELVQSLPDKTSHQVMVRPHVDIFTPARYSCAVKSRGTATAMPPLLFFSIARSPLGRRRSSPGDSCTRMSSSCCSGATTSRRCPPSRRACLNDHGSSVSLARAPTSVVWQVIMTLSSSLK